MLSLLFKVCYICFQTLDFILRQNHLHTVDQLTPNELSAIAELEHRQFATWEWNYGQSPKYAFNRKLRTPGGTVQAVMDVKNGHIVALRFYGDFFSRRDPDELATLLTGTPHTREAITAKLADLPVGDFFNNVTAGELTKVLGF